MLRPRGLLSGFVALGVISAGLTNADGLEVTSDQGFYDGAVVDGKPEGIGLFVFLHGPIEYFQGEFSDGHIDGEGLLKLRNGVLCKGAFDKDLNSRGLVTCRKRTKVIYRGRLKQGKMK